MTDSLRGLTASNPSQVGPVRAMRARDVSVPTEQELAAAEEIEVVLTGGVRPVPAAPARAPSPADLDRAHGPGNGLGNGLGTELELAPGLPNQPD
ncbi:MAG: hypothetical protein ACRDWG_20885 [Actinomycetes bacterium]|jgi:hypothetical protein